MTIIVNNVTAENPAFNVENVINAVQNEVILWDATLKSEWFLVSYIESAIFWAVITSLSYTGLGLK